jgi:hypothetical protein
MAAASEALAPLPLIWMRSLTAANLARRRLARHRPGRSPKGSAFEVKLAQP